MDTWGTVVVALIVAVSTLGAAWLQNIHSNKRFKIEIGRAIDVDNRKRRWEVRSKPLLKLRDELAVMATKAARIAKPGKNLAIPLEKTKEQEQEALDNAIRDWNDYILKDDFDAILGLQSDFEIIKLIKEIRNEYLYAFSEITSGDLQGGELNEIRRKAELEIAPQVAQAQELINKKLEEL